MQGTTILSIQSKVKRKQAAEVEFHAWAKW